MKTLNYIYSEKKDFVDFISKNNLLNYKNILLQIFTGIIDFEYIQSLIVVIKKLLPNIKIIGTTTAGEIINGTVTENKTIFSFSIFEKTEIITFFSEMEENGKKTAENLINKFPINKKAKAGITFSNGMTTNGELYIDTLRKYDDSLIIAGGLAGDNQKFKDTIVFNEEKVLENGVVIALLYSDELIAYTDYVLGWKTIGKLLKVTKVKENVVYEIENQKVIDIYSKYLGENIAKQLPGIGLEFPIVIHRNGLKIARTILVKNKDDSFVFAGNLSEGDKVSFAYRDINFLNEKRNDVYKNISKVNSESIFIYSCTARKNAMKKGVEMEIEPLQKISNTSGFFTYGEFFSNKENRAELLNQTMTILSLSENKKEFDKNIKFIDVINETESSRFIALSNLLTETLKELEEEIEKNREKERFVFDQAKKAQMGEMLSMIAHQWRQPLASINTLLLNVNNKIKINHFKLDKNENTNIFLDFLFKKSDKLFYYTEYLSSTIDDFRDFFKSDKGKKQVSIIQPIKNSLELMKGAFLDSNIEIIKDFKIMDNVFIYHNEIMQVILNILRNSKDNFIEKNIQNRQVKIVTDKVNNNYIIKISDNGGGIPENIIDKIFEPYFSTKNEKNGTGLGLYMSKMIVEKHHNGKLSVKNLEQGACFEINIKGEKNV